MNAHESGDGTCEARGRMRKGERKKNWNDECARKSAGGNVGSAGGREIKVERE